MCNTHTRKMLVSVNCRSTVGECRWRLLGNRRQFDCDESGLWG